jgi:hypothetical protein
MDDNHKYAGYMLRWVESLDWPSLDIAENTIPLIQAYWSDAKSVDLEGLRERLWAWVDANGGPRPIREKRTVLVRMLLCLAYEDNRELEDMGFFEDLLALSGLSRAEINKYGAANPPPRRA